MKVKISKIDAARNQLREAIKMWFCDGDLASTHMLACSAHQIIHDINKLTGGRDLIYDSIVVKDEYRKEWIKIIKSPYNFLKHAENDPDPSGEIELDKELTEFFILFSCLGLECLGYKHDNIEGAFIVYFMIYKPEFLKVDKKVEFFEKMPSDVINAMKGIPKKDFFDSYIYFKQLHKIRIPSH
jgi:hypothetical protein